jgi:hypothetical protein
MGMTQTPPARHDLVAKTADRTPAAQAMPQRMVSGKFHGEMATLTPRGHQCWTFVSPVMICISAGLPRTRILAA